MRTLGILLSLFLGVQGYPPSLYCYYTPPDEMSHVPAEARLQPHDIPKHCSHIVYGFAGISSKHQVVPSSEGDLPTISKPGTYETLVSGKRANAGQKVLLAVRPDPKVGHHTSPRADLNRLGPSLSFLTNPSTRWAFSSSVFKFLRQHGLDGVVLHIPNVEQHKWHYLQLLKDIRALMDGERLKEGEEKLTLDVFVPAKHLERCKAFLPDVARMGGLKEDSTNFAVINGVPKDKLIVGLSLWARFHSLLLFESVMTVGRSLDSWSS